MRWLSISCALLLAPCARGAFVETAAGRRIPGTRISATADGTVTLETASGQKMVFRKGQYRRAEADKPRNLARAESLLAAGKNEEAEPLLKEVQIRFRYLGWDQQAARRLAALYFGQGRFAEAARAFQTLENRTPEEQEKYEQALIRSGRGNLALRMLEQDIAGKSREAAARAYLLRAQLREERGDAAGARRDRIKVATFFRSQRELALRAERELEENGGTKR